MSLRGWQARVGDILESITNAQEYLEGISLEAFRSDKKTMRAVAYKLGIIGEAANHIPAEVQSRYPAVPWAKVRGMRNVIVHEYFQLDPDILWRTVKERLEPLVTHFQGMLEVEP